MKKVIVKSLTIMVIISVMLSNTAIAAKSLDETNKKINEAKEELNEIKTEKSETMQQVEELTGQISEYEIQIRTLDNQIEEMNSKIKDAEDNLNKAQEDYTKQEELLNKRLIASYEAGDTSYLDVLLSSESITDLISNYFLVTEIASYDMEVMQKIEAQKKEIETAKQTLESAKEQLDSSKAQKQEVATQLKNSKSQKDAQVAKLTESEKQTQAELDQFEADKKEIQAELALAAKKEREAQQNNSANNGGNTSYVSSSPSTSGFIFPVAGLSRANISNTSYPSYKGHTGVDVNISVSGKTIVAVKAGTVQRSMAYIKNGSYYSYGECIVINHGNGLATLYAHGSPGSRRVQVGDSVSQGQPIMTIGTTGNSTGEHLHFEVLVNGNPVNPMSYLP